MIKTFIDAKLRWPDQHTELAAEVLINVGNGEFSMRWYRLPHYEWSPALEVFCDGLRALKDSGVIPDLYALNSSNGFSPDTFKEFLLDHGFEDETFKGK